MERELTAARWREDWLDYCNAELSKHVDDDALGILATLSLLPIFDQPGRVAALVGDLISVCTAQSTDFFGTWGDWVLSPDTYAITPNGQTLLEVPRHPSSPLPPEFHAAAKNLITACLNHGGRARERPQKQSYFGAPTLSSVSPEIIECANAQTRLAQRIRGDESTHFANSAYYMGSKKALGPFIAESLRTVLGDDAVVLDLMCGSGAASKALSYGWRTIAADAMEFCVILAKALGAGYSLNRATSTLDLIASRVREHAEELMSLMESLVSQEESFFYSDLTDERLLEYINYVESTPRYPDGGSIRQWRPVEAIEARKQNPNLTPYCLVAAYFGNVFFGIRQSIEIDSIRYAIDQLDSEIDRAFALAALVASCSKLGTGYAGQFAQPVNLTHSNARAILSGRAQSAFHEFSVRFTALAAESEKAPNEILTVRGPWREVLSRVSGWHGPIPNAVYLDAPYTRDEYSRYYHVLETVVRYDYPSSVGIGRARDRDDAGYFRSPLFTKSRAKMTNEIIKIIEATLRQGWVCAWSYSDHGDANMLDVIEGVANVADVDVSSYSCPYQYKAQGGRAPKDAREYCIVFRPVVGRG